MIKLILRMILVVTIMRPAHAYPELHFGYNGEFSANSTESHRILNLDRILEMHDGWCARRSNGTICAMIKWREAREAGQKSAIVKQDPEEVRAMHEWWCEKPENKGVDGVCLKLDVDHMNEWWCQTNPESGLCEVLKWRAELRAGGMLLKGGGFKRPPPPNIGQHESRQMMKAWCEDSVNAETGPCGGSPAQ